MNHQVTSKNIDGITDLVVVAPIRPGFIEAYENVTHATRLEIVAEALNRVRVAAREHELITPFSDVTERILTLLDFRIGVVDRNLFALSPLKGKNSNRRKACIELDKLSQEPKRYLYLTATFDGAWEPYLRLIWDPLGPFLDLLFCNCDGYVTASEHSFEEYAAWVRDHQVDSAIFYATTGLTVRDHLYLNRLEQMQRARTGAAADKAIACMTMPRPEAAAAKERDDRTQLTKIHELALEALTVLYRLADFYPPEWQAGIPRLREGHYLARVAQSLLLGWEEALKAAPLPPIAEKVYAQPLGWYRSGQQYVAKLKREREAKRPKDPRLRRSEIQGGILKAQGSRRHPMRQGALMLMTVTDSAAARAFLQTLLDRDLIHFQEGAGSQPKDGFFRTLALTADGLRRLGLSPDTLDFFPKEFREGLEARAGLLGDVRENHPRRWTLPPRNGQRLPAGDNLLEPRPPIELSEIDLVLQVRTSGERPGLLIDEIERLAELAEPGLALLGYELMHNDYATGGAFIDYFGFRDGISQPKPTAGLGGDVHPDDKVRLGEIFLGYRNDRDDFAPERFSASFAPWRRRQRCKALCYQRDGTFLVVRKMEQHVDRFHEFIKAETARINKDHPGLPAPMTEDRLKARMLGRYPNGTPPIDPGDGSLNNFDYATDAEGTKCPFASHIRRVNPREPFQGRNAPRLMRRGMSFDQRDDGGGRGMMFMAYNASLAEQYETIQRWINGGNSTYVASGHGDPLMGVGPKTGALNPVDRVFRFVEGDEVVRVTMKASFVSLLWGLYLFVPSRTGLRRLCRLKGGYRPLPEMRETLGHGEIARLHKLSQDGSSGGEWKRLIEDLDAKDPSEASITPHIWSAIRYYFGGSLPIVGGMRLVEPPINWNKEPPPDQPVIISASWTHVMKVLYDWRTFTVEEQLRRIEPSGIPIYVAQQPSDDGAEPYKATHLQGRFDYQAESEATNAILMEYKEKDGFEDGYRAGAAVLEMAKYVAGTSRRDYFKIELRRQFLLPALQELCRIWYGLPDNDTFREGPWTWEPPLKRTPPGPRCPGDFLSPSRNTFYPRPGEVVAAFAEIHGKAVHEGSEAFVRKHRKIPLPINEARIARKMFAAIADDDVLARNLVGTMIGAIPPMDGNLRGILFEWFVERTLWRHQAALRRALGDRPAIADPAKAMHVLFPPVSQAMCLRPAPDLLYRTALKETDLKADHKAPGCPHHVEIKERALVVVSLVSATQRSFEYGENGDVSIVFGGRRDKAYQPDEGDISRPVHACPARPLAMGAIMGILAALLDSGRIQALPASLIVKISDW